MGVEFFYFQIAKIADHCVCLFLCQGLTGIENDIKVTENRMFTPQSESIRQEIFGLEVA